MRGKVISFHYAKESTGNVDSVKELSHEEFGELSKANKVERDSAAASSVGKSVEPTKKKTSANAYYVAFSHGVTSSDKLAEANKEPEAISSVVASVMPKVERAQKKNKSEKGIEKRPVTPPLTTPSGGVGPALVSPIGKLIKNPIRFVLEIQRKSKKRANKIVPYWLRKRERKNILLRARREEKKNDTTAA